MEIHKRFYLIKNKTLNMLEKNVSVFPINEK